MALRNLDRRCRALAKDGKRCRAAATSGGLCFFHANPNRASELGRIGGRKNKRWTSVDPADSLPTLDNATAIRAMVARLIEEVYAGKLHPKIAAGLAPLVNLQLRAIEATDLERRLAKLEKLLAETEAEIAGEGPPELDFGGLPMLTQSRPPEIERAERENRNPG